MGKSKRKVQKNQTLFSSSGTDENQTKSKGESKGKKTYNLQNEKSGGVEEEEEMLPKIKIPQKLESALVDLILDEHKNRVATGDLSNRLTSKKLTDVYNSLSSAGFSRNQVEMAMTNTIMKGGDLIDALDWLCLNIANDQLPEGFSETLLKEEQKHRPMFDTSLQKESLPIPEAKNEEHVERKPPSPKGKSPSANSGMKDWILKYAVGNSSDEEEDEDDEDEETAFNPTAQYTTLFYKVQELKDEAAIAKSNNNTNKHKAISKNLREIHLEMTALEKHPEFDGQVKAQLKTMSSEKASAKPKASVEEKPAVEDNDDGLGLNLFANAESESSSNTPSVTYVKDETELRSFTYTRSQWTGKSPKQFLIDWVRKHLPKSGPPKFKKIQVKVTRFKCTAMVQKPKEEQLCVTPEILCDNVKDAEHVASTLALYHLCPGQAIHQLLPPPYRNLWIEWLDKEKSEKDSAKKEENKPRDQFVSKLMKSLKIAPKKDAPFTTHAVGAQRVGNEVQEEDDWEALADKDEIPDFSAHASEGEIGRSERGKGKNSATSDLKKALDERQRTSQFQELLKSRQQLPVFQYREKIATAINNHKVVVIAGETGSGKSTQVPQFILEDAINHGNSNPHIICTQPRRISATSLARRVSQEMGEEGMRDEEALVGYHIRFESKRGPNTRLMYCTTGVVLRQLQMSQSLDNISHLIIDEVHERNVQSDFLMIVVKEILARRDNLKVILMSATLDSEKFSSYFGNCPVVNIPGRTFPVKKFYLEDVIEMTGYVIDEDSPYTLRSKDLVKEQRVQVEISQKGGNSSTQTLTWTAEEISRIDWTSLPANEYSLRTRNAVTRLNLNRINLDLICDLLRHLESSPPFCDVDGAVLVFLPGLADIQDLYELLTTDREFSNENKYQIFALHSVLSSHNQSQVFTVPKPGIRKIVLATNIAETGITISDVVFVIDSGKAKEKRYMEATQMSTLDEIFISKANSKQRAGRAGRVRDGFCFRIYTHEQFNGFRAFAVPELLCVPLEEICLIVMKCGYGNPSEFLAGALDPPLPLSVSRAISLLTEVGACHLDGTTLTPLGHHLSVLPVDVRIGKMLVFGALFGCLEQVAVIAAGMTGKSPFVLPLSKKSEVDAVKQSMAVACSDHLTLYKAYTGWRSAQKTGRSAETLYLNRNFLKRSILQEIETVKKDLIKLLESIGFSQSKRAVSKGGPSSMLLSDGILKISSVPTGTAELDSATVAMVKAVLTAGLYPQVGKVMTEPPLAADETVACVAQTAQGPAHVHPSSINKHLAATGSWLVYHEKVRVSRVYLRDTTIIQPYAILLFGGGIDVQHTQQIMSVDGWIKFKAVARTGVIFKELRNLLNKMLERKITDPSLDVSSCLVTSLLKDLIKCA